MMMSKKPLSPEAAQIRAEELCARAEHSSGEILEKLRKWGVPSDRAAQIVDRMIDTRFIDDARFAAAYVRDKVRFAHWGRRKIAMGLYQKRVARDIIDDALENISDDEYLKALDAVIASKMRTTPDAASYDGRTRVYRHALSRGFESPLIVKQIKLYLTNQAHFS